VGSSFGVASCFLSFSTVFGQPIKDEGGSSLPVHDKGSGVFFTADGEVNVVDLVGGRGN
jgi:hypothetical protein